MFTSFIEEFQKILEYTPSDVNIQESLGLLFDDKSHYGCQKEYPVAVVHEKTRITDSTSLAFFEQNSLIDANGFTPCVYSDTQIKKIISHAPSYIQRVNYIVSKSKMAPQPTFFNKFKHDYWKKIKSVEGLEALIDITAFPNDTTECEVEASLRAIIRKRKEVHQLKKLTFIWVVETKEKSTAIETVLKHYFNEDYSIIEKEGKTYFIGWSTPLQSINMRYFVCPPV